MKTMTNEDILVKLMETKDKYLSVKEELKTTKIMLIQYQFLTFDFFVVIIILLYFMFSKSK